MSFPNLENLTPEIARSIDEKISKILEDELGVWSFDDAGSKNRITRQAAAHEFACAETELTPSKFLRKLSDFRSSLVRYRNERRREADAVLGRMFAWTVASEARRLGLPPARHWAKLETSSHPDRGFAYRATVEVSHQGVTIRRQIDVPEKGGLMFLRVRAKEFAALFAAMPEPGFDEDDEDEL